MRATDAPVIPLHVVATNQGLSPLLGETGYSCVDRNRAYNKPFARTVYRELDDTIATEHVAHFQAILSTLNLKSAEAIFVTAS